MATFAWPSSDLAITPPGRFRVDVHREAKGDRLPVPHRMIAGDGTGPAGAGSASATAGAGAGTDPDDLAEMLPSGDPTGDPTELEDGTTAYGAGSGTAPGDGAGTPPGTAVALAGPARTEAALTATPAGAGETADPDSSHFDLPAGDPADDAASVAPDEPDSPEVAAGRSLDAGLTPPDANAAAEEAMGGAAAMSGLARPADSEPALIFGASLASLPPQPLAPMESGSSFAKMAEGEATAGEASPADRLGLSGKRRERAETCLAEAVYFESRGEPERGQIAVAQVVMNRVFSGYYPADVCRTVYQNAHRHLACQFTFACDNVRDVVTEPEAWQQARRIAADMLDGRIWDEQVGRATHYHAQSVHPRWVREMRKLDAIGEHTFYRPRRWG
ncbi:cell wall hydrolase [Ancylobacter lacus]|nr:cell wall hydrolase [Ancylobacter lacus]